MKAFYTPEHITPIIAEINAFYKPITDRVVMRALNCDLLLQSNTTRNAYTVRAGQPFYYNRGAVKELMQEVRDYAKTAETEPGELDDWTWNEQNRIMCAIRDALLKKYTGGQTHV